MTRIGLVDTTVRDGHQSLWSANALTTPMIERIAPALDRAGFHAVDFTSSTHMAMAVRWHREDPWERIRRIADAMPQTPLGFITPGMRFMSWERAPREVMELAIRCVVRNGIRRIWIAESMNDTGIAVELARIARAAGAAETLVGLVFSLSPVHTDDYYAARAREVAASPDVDVLNLKDPGGLLTPERVATLVPALRAAAPDLPLEVHTHMTVSLGEESYLAAADAGARYVCTAARPLAYGTSQPATERVVELLRARGFDVAVDDEAVEAVSAYFTELARELGRETGKLLPRDELVYRHQLPGGMTSTLRRQLAEIGMEDRWDDVLAELPRVREELGWPIMVTPLSQFIGVQAFLNVTTGERYAQMPDEVVKLVLGHYGEPPGEIDPDVRARALRLPEPPERRLDLAAARARYGDAMPDEELLLRMVLPPAQVDAVPSYVPRRARHPLVELVEELGKRDFAEIEARAPGVRVRMRR